VKTVQVQLNCYFSLLLLQRVTDPSDNLTSNHTLDLQICSFFHPLGMRNPHRKGSTRVVCLHLHLNWYIQRAGLVSALGFRKTEGACMAFLEDSFDSFDS